MSDEKDPLPLVSATCRRCNSRAFSVVWTPGGTLSFRHHCTKSQVTPEIADISIEVQWRDIPVESADDFGAIPSDH